ncbi:MAG: hypothetical protein EOM21_20015, partial [Gammaproteobacteria bacterium]|nr:hypothetical protein [Gammaproteobacteria bacterium]
MTRHYLWNADAELLTKPIPAVLMDLRREDGDNDLLMDALGMSDIMEGVECVALDGVVTQYQKIERIAGQMERVMLRASGDVKPIAHQVSDPFIQLAVLHVAVIFELSDGQTISVFFHNPDTTPKKI